MYFFVFLSRFKTNAQKYEKIITNTKTHYTMTTTRINTIKLIESAISEYITDFADGYNAVKVGEKRDITGGDDIHIDFSATFIEVGQYNADCRHYVSGVAYLSGIEEDPVWVDIHEVLEKWLPKEAAAC